MKITEEERQRILVEKLIYDLKQYKRMLAKIEKGIVSFRKAKDKFKTI